MKKLELSNFGVQELDAKQMKMTDGGISINPWQAIASWLIVDSLNNPREFINSALKGFR